MNRELRILISLMDEILKIRQNAEIRWEEYSDTNKISDPCRHLKSNTMCAFTWKDLMATPIKGTLMQI